MKIGGVIAVRGEQLLIELNIRYHLDVQKFDLILIIDNGSTDNTHQIVKSPDDPRIIIRRTKPDVGNFQDLFCNRVRWSCSTVLAAIGCCLSTPMNSGSAEILEPSRRRLKLLIAESTYSWLDHTASMRRNLTINPRNTFCAASYMLNPSLSG